MTIAQNNDAGIKSFSFHLEEVEENDDGTVTYNLFCCSYNLQKRSPCLITEDLMYLEGLSLLRK